MDTNVTDKTVSRLHRADKERPRKQASLTPRWPNVDPVDSTLGQRGNNVPFDLGKYTSLFPD